MGGAFFIEDGIETGIIMQFNLAIFVRQSTSLLNDDVTPGLFGFILYYFVRTEIADLKWLKCEYIHTLWLTLKLLETVKFIKAKNFYTFTRTLLKGE